MRDRHSENADVVPFPGDNLDKAGQEVLTLLHQAAGIAERNTQNAIGVAQELSVQLRAAEERIKEVEGQYWSYRNRAERAEEWLRRISQEIQHTFAPAEQGGANRANGQANGASSDFPPRKAQAGRRPER